MKALRARAWEFLEGEREASRGRRLFDGFLLAIILLNVVFVALESEPGLGARYRGLFAAFEVFSIAIFTVEYVLRVWAAPANPADVRHGAAAARLRYAVTPLALIDLLAILPFYLSFLVAIDLRVLRLLRVLRILKLTRYSPALSTMTAVARKERKTVLGALCIVLVLVVIAAALMYALEHEAQPDAFGSIPDAMWWAVATLTTVGYGDVIPVTPLGRIVGGIVMVLGIGIFVLWTSIFAAGFMEEMRKRSFVVTWNLVARVPAFASLDAKRIAEISELLKPEVLPPRFTVIRRGEVADAMFFVVSGELEVDLPTQVMHIHEGHFFGEMSLIESGTRRATVTTLTECQLLRLEKSDFEALMEAEPELREAMARSSREWTGSVEASEI